MATMAARSRRESSRGSVSSTEKMALTSPLGPSKGMAEQPPDAQVGPGQPAVGQGRVAAGVGHLDRLAPPGDYREELGVLQGLTFGPERQRAPAVSPHHGEKGQRASRSGGADQKQVGEGLTSLADTVAFVTPAARAGPPLSAVQDHPG